MDYFTQHSTFSKLSTICNATQVCVVSPRGGLDLLAPCCLCLLSFNMGPLKELLLIVAIIVALVALAWFSEPTENFLHTGRTCREIREHLAAKQDRDLSPAEETDMANCT